MATSSPAPRSSLPRHLAAKLAVCGAATAALVQCGYPPPPPAPDAVTATQPPSATTTPARPPAPTTSTPPATVGARVTWVTAADLGATWRPECPVGPEDLRRVETNFHGFDGRTHRGALVVHEDVVAQTVDILEELYALGYPIARMRTVDEYPGAEDELSMADNNTSAFNCRGIPGSRSWSQHAYGRAIDLNPLINPYIDASGHLEPANAGPYTDRSRNDPGLLHDGDAAVEVFRSRGWRWGGDWRTPKDYQHFELP